MPAKDELPSTLRRSPAKARRTWSTAHDSAVESYGDGERAHGTAFAALRHAFQKVGDHWEAKASKGPSDPQARRSGRAARAGRGKTDGGVDVEGSTRQQLLALARRLGVRGRSRTTEDQLGEAVARANTRFTRRARARSIT